MPHENELAETLIGLLDGDFVRIATADRSVTTEVIDHTRETANSTDDRWRYAIRFMPVGEDATRVTPDRYRILVEPDGEGWTVSDLIAEVFVEDDLSYELESRGGVTNVESLGRP